MRPRVFPAEDRVVGIVAVDELAASMRPRVFPAEDSRFGSRLRSAATSFNEAAGIPRGRPSPRAESSAPAAGASMRPRVFPAEDSRSGSAIARSTRASMRPRVFPAEDLGLIRRAVRLWRLQ